MPLHQRISLWLHAVSLVAALTAAAPAAAQIWGPLTLDELKAETHRAIAHSRSRNLGRRVDQ